MSPMDFLHWFGPWGFVPVALVDAPVDSIIPWAWVLDKLSTACMHLFLLWMKMLPAASDSCHIDFLSNGLLLGAVSQINPLLL